MEGGDAGQEEGYVFDLSVSGDKRSFEHSTKEDKIRSRFCYGTNDLAESALGGVTGNLQEGGILGVHRAAGESVGKPSGYFNRFIPKKKKGGERPAKTKGLFHRESPLVRKVMIRVGMRDRAQVHRQDLREVDEQRKEKRQKERIAKEKGLRKSKRN